MGGTKLSIITFLLILFLLEIVLLGVTDSHMKKMLVFYLFKSVLVQQC
jgi:hypothetical protein